MSLTINTNTAAISAAANLSTSNAMLQHALAELSSGSKIVHPSDDAGGLAVSMRMGATISETNAVITNVANGSSFLQTQDGSLNVAGSILTRVAELETMASDPTKNAGDISNYNSEFTALKSQLTDLTSGTFNGVNLFGGGSLTVGISADGSVTQSITQSDLSTDVTSVTGAANSAAVTLTQVTTALNAVATAACAERCRDQRSRVRLAGSDCQQHEPDLGPRARSRTWMLRPPRPSSPRTTCLSRRVRRCSRSEQQFANRAQAPAISAR